MTEAKCQDKELEREKAEATHGTEGLALAGRNDSNCDRRQTSSGPPAWLSPSSRLQLLDSFAVEGGSITAGRMLLQEHPPAAA